tara:strand:- start:397 stop:1128 length:732 start_codon:yes stop_codon:yes gene_type:complete
MVNKNTLQSVISKYNLGGLIDKVKWRVKDNTLTIYSNADGLACKVQLKDFQLEDGELGIFDTDKLKKLIAITNGELILSLEKQGAILTKLNIADENFDLTYGLSDIFLFRPDKWYEHPEEGYAMEIDLQNTDIDHLIKAKNALGDVQTMQISSQQDLDGNDVCEFKFGDNNNFSNKIIFNTPVTLHHKVESVIYNSDIFKRVLNANSDMMSCKMSLSKVGWSHFSFENEELTSEYFVRQEEEV